MNQMNRNVGKTSSVSASTKPTVTQVHCINIKVAGRCGLRIFVFHFAAARRNAPWIASAIGRCSPLNDNLWLFTFARLC